ncbi:hypothetical protein CAEBREN_29537 [Caenorhabditis brenneri]|uniref:Abnormal cell migration protein 18-like fibronectin type I domain-containing protein n=1 Tax=Caenorhabditis brenneri TaxID=135651 RepID=G0N6C4_CAEBE|nr:hypothetical protein CAEBREN_29537 [Caenorhabditis brenneri]
MIPFLLLLPILFLASNSAPADTSTHKPPSSLHHFEINHPDGINAIFDLLPKVCKKNGKTYKMGEEFDVGNLRYTCQEFGVYVIAGCRTHTGKPLKLGDIEVIDHVKFHCLAHGTSVYYRETACGKKGEVDCDKVPLPRGYEQAVKNEPIEATEKPPAHLTHVNGKELPKGWVLIHGGTKEADNKNDTLSTHILMYHPQLHHSAKHAY